MTECRNCGQTWERHMLKFSAGSMYAASAVLVAYIAGHIAHYGATLDGDPFPSHVYLSEIGAMIVAGVARFLDTAKI